MEKANTKPDVCIRFYHEVKNFHTIINYCVIKFKKRILTLSVVMIFDILQYNNECSPIKFNKEFLQEEHGPQSFHNQQYPTIIPMFTLSIFWHCHISILNAIQYHV